MKLVAVILLAFLSPAEQLDSERDEPTYKFGIVAGEPDTLNGSTSVQVATFEECVEKCETDETCVLASQVADGEPCNLFQWNSITGVRNNASGGEGQVAFRVYTNQPACDLNLPHLLNGKTYQIYPNTTEEYLWKIDTSEGGWTITYTRKVLDDSVICGNWSFDRPYVDGCCEECNVTMVQIYATPGPLTGSPRVNTTTNWMDCMVMCYKTVRCLVAYMVEGTNTCKMYEINQISFLERKTAADGERMGLKLPVSNKSCLYTTEQLLNDNYYLAYPTVLANRKRTFYRVRTTEKYYKIFTYVDEKATYDDFYIRGCMNDWKTNGILTEPNETALCSRPFQLPGITQPEARAICKLFDGDLFVERSEKMLDSAEGLWLSMRWVVYGFEWGFYTNPDEVKAWMGLTKDPDCVGADASTSYCQGNQKWQWTPSSWVTLNTWPTNQTKMAMTWGPGEPAESDDKKCAYFRKSASLPGNYSMFAESCDSTTMDGFICGTHIQADMGIKPFAEVADEYGIYQDCCVINMADQAYRQAHP